MPVAWLVGDLMDLPHHLRQTESKTEKFHLPLSLLVSLSHSSAEHADRFYHISGLQKHLLQLQSLLPKSHYRNRGLLLENILHIPEQTLQGRGGGLEGCDTLLSGFSSWTSSGPAIAAPSSPGVELQVFFRTRGSLGHGFPANSWAQ